MSTLPDLACLPQKIFKPWQESPKVTYRDVCHSIKWSKKSSEVFHQKYVRTGPYVSSWRHCVVLYKSFKSVRWSVGLLENSRRLLGLTNRMVIVVLLTGSCVFPALSAPPKLR